MKTSASSRGQSVARHKAQHELFADFGELVLSIAREVSLHTETSDDLVHLTATEINVMRFIDRHPGTTPKEAAAGLGLQRSNFSVTARSLRDRRTARSARAAAKVGADVPTKVKRAASKAELSRRNGSYS